MGEKTIQSSIIMALSSKLGSLLRQNGQTPMISSMLSSLRCMSTSSKKLFIGGLSYGTDDQTLKEAFSGFGDVTEARVIVDRDTGRSRGFGFVNFADDEAANSALSAMDGQELHGRNIRVSYANERPSGPRSFGGNSGGFRGDRGSFGGDSGQFHGIRLFCGSVNANIYANPLSQSPSSLYFFLFKSSIVMPLSGKLGSLLRQNGQTPMISSMLNSLRCMSTSSKQLFVGGLSYDSDEQTLKEAFSGFADVTEVQVPVDRTGRSRGFGFVSFADDEAANKALSAMDGQEIHGRSIRVSYANERPSGPRSFGGNGGGFRGDRGGSGGDQVSSLSYQKSEPIQRKHFCS
ncbi:hypothetical protein V6N12_061331 [Hibiscus sabdariffa]|uniref:RRM domain-containing protein n=1 Tax=Hibiscus sabdariffa TaxID=183260 RepID=A0ABR2DWR9_9ROSI